MTDMTSPGARASATGAEAEQSCGPYSPPPATSQEPEPIRLVVRNLYEPTCGTRPGLWRVETADGDLLLARARLPLLDGARALLARGLDPDAPITMRLADRSYDCFLPVAVRVAARMTVEEGRRSAHFRRHREEVPESVRGRADLPASEPGDDADQPESEIAAHDGETTE